MGLLMLSGSGMRETKERVTVGKHTEQSLLQAALPPAALQQATLQKVSRLQVNILDQTKMFMNRISPLENGWLQ